MQNMRFVSQNESGFPQYLLFMLNSESGLFRTSNFAADVYNSLQNILVFLSDVPKPTDKRKR